METNYEAPQMRVIEIEIEDAVLSDSGVSSGISSTSFGSSWGNDR